MVAMDMALNLGSINCAKPFLRLFQEGGYIAGNSQSGTAKYNIAGTNRTRSEAYLMLGTMRATTKKRDGSIVHSRVEKEAAESTESWEVPQAKLRADVGYNEAACGHDDMGRVNSIPKAIRVSKTVHIYHQRDV